MSSIETDADPETSVTVAASLHFVYAVLPNNRQCNVLFFDVHCFVLDFILYCIFFIIFIIIIFLLLVGRQEGHPACKKTEWWGAGVVICLERGADLHVAQLMPLPLTISCFSKIQIGFTFLVLAHLGSPGQRATKLVCVCVYFLFTYFSHTHTRPFNGPFPGLPM